MIKSNQNMVKKTTKSDILCQIVPLPRFIIDIDQNKSQNLSIQHNNMI